MEAADRIEAFFDREQPFKEGISLLRKLAKTTGLKEALKWGAPVYTMENKNILGIMAFKNHFGIWFFNGAFLRDPQNVLENAQEGKTKAMRHWKFRSPAEIDQKMVLAYIQEAMTNQEQGKVHVPKKNGMEAVPPSFRELFDKNKGLERKFQSLAPYKQREYYEYINTAKQEKTKLSRMAKCIPLIEKGMGLNDVYRN
jgi:uncharacterized protein YdeI (YjbR/CyaY-like superfamily)